MKVSITFFGGFRNLFGTAQTCIEMEGGSVKEVLSSLVAEHEDSLRDVVLAPDGSVKESILLVLNGNVIDRRVPSNYLVRDGDTLAILPPVVGGA